MSRDENASATRLRTIFVASAVLLMTGSFVLIKTSRDALYFQRSGLFDLPKAYIGIAALSVPFAVATLWLMKTLGPRRARVVAPLLMAVALSVSGCFVRPGGGLFMTVFFMVIPLAFGVLFSLTWLLAADLLDGIEQARLAKPYAIIGACSIIGGILGGTVAKLLSMRVMPRTLLWVGAGMLAASALVMFAAQSRFPPHAIIAATKKGAYSRSAVSAVFKHPYAAVLLVVAMSASLTGIFVEFQFYLAAASTQQTGQQSANFFANFYLILNAGALVVQLWLMPRLQKGLGVHGSLLIMPVALLGGAAVLMTNTSLLMRSGLKVTEGGLKASIHRANWEQAFLPVGRAQRTAAKLIIDGAAARLAEGLAAIALYVWLVTVVGEGSLVGRSTGWITWSIAGTAGAWLGLSWWLRRHAMALETAAPREASFRVAIPLPDT